MGHAVAVCGMPGSGKGEFANIIAANGVPVRSMGDMIRAEVRRHGLDEAPHVFGEVEHPIGETGRWLQSGLIGEVDRFWIVLDTPLALPLHPFDLIDLRGVGDSPIQRTGIPCQGSRLVALGGPEAFVADVGLHGVYRWVGWLITVCTRCVPTVN